MVSLDSLPLELIESIAFELVDNALLGPPSHLLPLLTTSRRLHAALSPPGNPALYARIFRAKFDTDALARRFPPGARTNAILAVELVRRFTVLARIRDTARSSDFHIFSGEEDVETDLWITYLMCLESDGKNARQLREWALLPQYLDLYIDQVLIPRSTRPGYTLETIDKSLAIWNLWFMTDLPSLFEQFDDPQRDARFHRLLRPLAFTGFKYDIFLAPWNIFNLPLSNFPQPLHAAHRTPPSMPRHDPLMDIDPTDPDNAALHFPAPAPARALPAGPTLEPAPEQPTYLDLTPREHIHSLEYHGTTLYISPPKLALAAILLLSATAHRFPPRLNNDNEQNTPGELLSETMHPLQLERSGRTGKGYHGGFGERQGMWEDGRGWERHWVQTRMPHLRDSRSFDADWMRMTNCLSPFKSSVKPKFFEPGMVAGTWEGRSGYVDASSWEAMVSGDTRALHRPTTIWGLSSFAWVLQEHHLVKRFDDNVDVDVEVVDAMDVDMDYDDSESVSSDEPTTYEVEYPGIAATSALTAHLPFPFAITHVPGGIVVRNAPGSTVSSASTSSTTIKPDGVDLKSGEYYYRTWTGKPWGRDGFAGDEYAEAANGDFPTEEEEEYDELHFGGVVPEEKRGGKAKARKVARESEKRRWAGAGVFPERQTLSSRSSSSDIRSSAASHTSSPSSNRSSVPCAPPPASYLPFGMDIDRGLNTPPTGFEDDPDMDGVFGSSGDQKDKKEKIMDILITGTPAPGTPFHGQHRIYGRIRPWDGLVTLFRTWIGAADNRDQNQLFRGYITSGGNWVGRWMAVDLAGIDLEDLNTIGGAVGGVNGDGEPVAELGQVGWEGFFGMTRKKDQ